MQSKFENQNKKRQTHQEKDGLPGKYIFEAAVDGLIISNLKTGILLEVNPAACSMYGFQSEELIGRPATDLIEPSYRNMYNEYVMAVQAHSSPGVLLTHRRKDGSNFYVEMRGKIIDFSGQAYMLSTLHDVSHWILAEKTLQEQAEAHQREQSTLLEISQTLASTLELKPGIVLDQLRVVIEYMHTVRFEFEDKTLVAVSARGSTLLEQAIPFSIKISDPKILTALFNEHRPTLIADVWSDAPEAKFVRFLLNDKVDVLLEGMHAWMWVPIAFKGRLLGGLEITHTQKGFFTTHQADLALIVANQAAIAIVNTELYTHAQALAALQERQRLARELHDAVNQSLFSAGLIAEVLPRLWDKDPVGARQSLEKLRRLTHGAQADMRLLLDELRPEALTDSDLGDLLRLLGNAFTGRTNIPVKITVDGQWSLPGEVQLAFYRLSQEGFNDIAKHADAKKVEVLLHFDKGVADLSIIDDGCGFDPDYVPFGHFGLSMMRERAEAVGASLSIKSRLRQGTEILIHWAATSGKKAV